MILKTGNLEKQGFSGLLESVQTWIYSSFRVWNSMFSTGTGCPWCIKFFLKLFFFNIKA